MGKGKDLPAVDFHAAIAKRDPALAERMAREGLASPVSLVEPETPSRETTVDERLASPSPPAPAELSRLPVRHALSEVASANEAMPVSASLDLRRRRGLVPRANGREAGRITVYVPPDLALRLKKYCFERDTTMNEVAGNVLIEALERLLGNA